MNKDWLSFDDALAFRNGKDTTNSSSSRLKNLVQKAEATMWKELPLRAIAEAHKTRAENLEWISATIDEVYIEYFKYLQLYPHTEDFEYNRVFKHASSLEKHLGGECNLRLNDLDALSAPPRSTSTAWTTVLMGVLPYALIALVVRAVSA